MSGPACEREPGCTVRYRLSRPDAVTRWACTIHLAAQVAALLPDGGHHDTVTVRDLSGGTDRLPAVTGAGVSPALLADLAAGL